MSRAPPQFLPQPKNMQHQNVQQPCMPEDYAQKSNEIQEMIAQQVQQQMALMKQQMQTENVNPLTQVQMDQPQPNIPLAPEYKPQYVNPKLQEKFCKMMETQKQESEQMDKQIQEMNLYLSRYVTERIKTLPEFFAQLTDVILIMMSGIEFYQSSIPKNGKAKWEMLLSRLSDQLYTLGFQDVVSKDGYIYQMQTIEKLSIHIFHEHRKELIDIYKHIIIADQDIKMQERKLQQSKKLVLV